MAVETVIEKSELQILINPLQKDRIVVGYPVYDILLFLAEESERGYTVRVLAGKRILE